MPKFLYVWFLTARRYVLSVCGLLAVVLLLGSGVRVGTAAEIPAGTANFFGRAYTGARHDFTGTVGYEFTPVTAVHIKALGRSVSGGKLQRPHQVTIWNVRNEQPIAQITVTPESKIDPLGYAVEMLAQDVVLEADQPYRISSSEQAGGDPLFDIADVRQHLAVADISSGVYGVGKVFPGVPYGGSDQGYGLPTFYFATSGLDTTLLKADAHTPRPFVRDLDVGYLLRCNFNALEPYCWKGTPKLSGWETDLAGGTWDYSFKKEFDHEWFKLIDTSTTAGVMIQHQIARQTAGRVTLEYRFRMPVKMDGVCWQLRDLQQAGVSIATIAGNLCWENTPGKPTILGPYAADHDYGVKVVADLSTHTADVYIDGQPRGQGLPFSHAIESLDYVRIQTGAAATGELYLGPVNIYKGYALHETFVTGQPGTLPANWTAGTDAPISGKVTVEKFACGPGPDLFSLKLAGTPDAAAVATTRFAAVQAKSIFECRFLLPEKRDGMSLELGAANGAALGIRTGNGALGLNPTNSGGNVVLLPEYRANLWYMLKIVTDPARGSADIFINGKVAARGAAIGAVAGGFDTVKFYATRGVLWIDDVQVYPWKDYPADYVPEPHPCPAKPPYILGLQSCNLWRDGSAYAGWDYVYPYRAERKPYLGWYEEGNPEESDWEIKWLVEHGITFEMHCWYRPSHYAVGNPIKDGDMDSAIVQGLFNARYSALKKFAIMYTNDNGGYTTPDDFRQNIVPYWIEYFFKDPRYFTLDGKPVICLYNYDKLAQDLGGPAGVKSAVQYLRDQAAKAGFPGLIILTVRSGGGQTAAMMRQRKAAGFDAVYSYAWFTSGLEPQKACNLAQRAAATAASLDQVPSFGMGWDCRPWGGGRAGWATKDEYKKLAQWTRDEFMPSQPATALGRRLMILDNWSEFGEGHVIMPSNIHGFDYLDVLREVFTAGGPHEDMRPTEQQKRRFTVFYPHE